MRKNTLTVGMAVHTDYDGLWATLTTTRLFQKKWVDQLLVIDNTKRPAEAQLNFELCNKMMRDTPGMNVRYIHSKQDGTARPRNLVFQESASDYTLCVDSHVILHPGACEAIHEYIETFPDNKDLLHGPLCYDDTEQVLATHMEPQWGTDVMLGTWHTTFQEDKWLEIPAHGMGLFGMRTKDWVGFNDNFRNFGGEEVYTHAKVRQRGGRCVCIKGLKWQHRFTHIRGKGFESPAWRMMANYIIGRVELGLRWDDVLIHFRDHKGQSEDDIEEALAAARKVYPDLPKPDEGNDLVMYSAVQKKEIIVRQDKKFINFANVDGYDQHNSILPVIHPPQNTYFGIPDLRESADLNFRKSVDVENDAQFLASISKEAIDHMVQHIPAAIVATASAETSTECDTQTSTTTYTETQTLPPPPPKPPEKKPLAKLSAHPVALSAAPQIPPKVTAICMTFGRAGTKYQRLLEESIQSFLLQSWPHKELIIINDARGSELKCGAHNVQIINLPKRCLSLGEKFAIGMSMAEEYVAVWDDDDISLPGRLDQAMSALQKDPTCFMYNSQRYWFWPVGVKGETTYEGIVDPKNFGYGLMTSVFKRSVAVEHRLIEPTTGDYDKIFMEKVARLGLPVLRPALEPSAWQYIYRWGVSAYHASSSADLNAKYVEAGTAALPTGTYHLNPHWKHPYDAFVQKAIVALAKKGTVTDVIEYV